MHPKKKQKKISLNLQFSFYLFFIFYSYNCIMLLIDGVFISVDLFAAGFFPAGGLSIYESDLTSKRVCFNNSYREATISGYA